MTTKAKQPPATPDPLALLVAVHDHLEAEMMQPHPDAPGHCHSVPGHWDADGSPCEWCTTWAKVRECVKSANNELVCTKPQMRKAEEDVALLRNALVGIIGASDKAELERLELAVRVLPAPDADKIAGLNAIHALLATLPNSEPTTPKAKS